MCRRWRRSTRCAGLCGWAAFGCRSTRIDEMAADDLWIAAVVEATLGDGAEPIENYPRSKPNPSCLVLGRLRDGSPVHVVWAIDAPSGYASMVTAYRPTATQWSADFRKRVKT